MSQEELNAEIQADPYLINRKKPTAYEERLYLKEVHHKCPLCGKSLLVQGQPKENKLYEIAHIYPNSPTPDQRIALNGLQRLGSNSEDYENKIALCRDCHKQQDFQTTKEDYLKLYQIKQNLLRQTILESIADNLPLEDGIAEVISRLCTLSEDDFATLNYSPVTLAKKFDASDYLLKNKVLNNVTTYYPHIRQQLRSMEGTNGFSSEAVRLQIRCCFVKMEMNTDNKTEIFNQMVMWLKNKTLSSSTEACEAVISFFVQDCEVFREITE